MPSLVCPPGLGGGGLQRPLPCRPVSFEHVFYSRYLLRAMRLKHLCHDPVYACEMYPAFQKETHADLVSRVQYGRGRAAHLERPVGEPQAREPRRVRVAELKGKAAEIERPYPACHPLRVRERVGDGPAHVRCAHLSHHRAVYILDH